MIKLVKRVFWTAFILSLGVIAFLVGYYYPRVPELNTDLFEFNQNAIIYDKYDQPYQNLQGIENRQTVTSEQISELTKHAFIAIEDKRFYSHSGVDILSIGRALSEVFTNQNLNGSGGSTITQQLIKLTHLTTERSIERKFDEWVLALRLEREYSKEDILTAYLNKVNFHGAEGIQAAARQYFGKNALELDIAESAILAAIPNSPTYFDPYTYDASGQIVYDERGQIVLNPNNTERALRVISQMYEQEYISLSDKESAERELRDQPHLQFNNPNKVYSYFTDEVYFQLLADLTAVLGISEEDVVEFINTSGIKVYSTVDPALQATMEQACLNESLFPGRSNSSVAVEGLTGEVYSPEVGMTVVDNEDGSVAAMVGGRNNNASLTLNRATARFQTGSATKPLTTYAPALEEKKITLASVYDDAPLNLDGWQPQNSSQTYIGSTTVRNALVQSINTVAVRTFLDLGVDQSTSYAAKLGLTVPDSDKNPAALALGGYTEGFTTEEMAAAYSCFARSGEYIKPYLYRRVEDSAGNVLIENRGEKERVFSNDVSFLITDVLKQACTIGTTQISIPGVEVAGKTGTTDGLVNAWFCGYTPSYSMAVWYGYDTNQVDVGGNKYPLAIEIPGGNKPGPAAMFETVMTQTAQKKPAFDIQTRVIPVTENGTQEYYIDGTQPDKENTAETNKSASDSDSDDTEETEKLESTSGQDESSHHPMPSSDTY